MRRTDRSNGSPSDDRYRLTMAEFEGKQQKALVRTDIRSDSGAPNRLFVIRSYRKSISDLMHVKHPDNTIYIDGACEGPYIDARRRIYSLDHHGNCIRQFTMASCEQALLLARYGHVDSTGFNIVANDPDMDTVLAAWALMNADNLAYRDDVFRKMNPIYLLAGNVDRHGFGYEEMVLPDEIIRRTREKILWFHNHEEEEKKKDRWGNIDYAEFTERVFRDIDDYAFYQDSPEEEVVIQGQETLEIPGSGGQTVLFVRSNEGGIYGAIRELVIRKKDKNCACVVWTDGKNRWTIKTTGIITKYDLRPVFERLRDEEEKARVAKNVLDLDLLKSNWGGEATIGGQPRYYDGSGPFIDGDKIRSIVMEELAKQV